MEEQFLLFCYSVRVDFGGKVEVMRGEEVERRGVRNFHFAKADFNFLRHECSRLCDLYRLSS